MVSVPRGPDTIGARVLGCGDIGGGGALVG